MINTSQHYPMNIKLGVLLPYSMDPQTQTLFRYCTVPVLEDQASVVGVAPHPG